jgi:hypothetical protein
MSRKNILPLGLLIVTQREASQVQRDFVAIEWRGDRIPGTAYYKCTHRLYLPLRVCQSKHSFAYLSALFLPQNQCGFNYPMDRFYTVFFGASNHFQIMK